MKFSCRCCFQHIDDTTVQLFYFDSEDSPPNCFKVVPTKKIGKLFCNLYAFFSFLTNSSFYSKGGTSETRTNSTNPRSRLLFKRAKKQNKSPRIAKPITRDENNPTQRPSVVASGDGLMTSGTGPGSNMFRHPLVIFQHCPSSIPNATFSMQLT
jgi:hypothetical protein